MAIEYGEYGYYDTDTGQTIVNVGGESGPIWQTSSSEVAAPIAYGSGALPTVGGVPVPTGAAPAYFEISDFTLGPARQEGGYLVRGDYRMPMGANQKTPGGALEYNDNGTWKPVGEGSVSGYDARQYSNVLDSNERRQFDTAFATAPEGIDIRTGRQYALEHGWTEPDRSNNEGTLGSLISTVGPYVALLMGGVGALNGLAGLGMAGAGETAALAAGDAMAGAIPAGELAAWTGATGAGAGALSAAELAAADSMAGAIPAGELGAWTGAAEAGAGAYPWLDAAGNLDVDAFLQATAPGGEYAGAIPGGAEGIAGMDTLGSTSWLESAANSLAHGDTSWLTQNITPSQVKSVISKLTGGGTATPRTGTRTGTTAAGALGGILPIVADSGPSGIESVLAANADARKSADAFAQAMAQSGKGV